MRESSGFTHLHLHSQYSLLDGAIRMDDLAPTIKERGMQSVALTVNDTSPPHCEVQVQLSRMF
ncbi:MAG TPA: PHP domain-containing protein, partial [Myxococcales bacterium]|nr:PHP domain-containing protein [Myxococcales bacterium]